MYIDYGNCRLEGAMIETKVFEPKTKVEMQENNKGCTGGAAALGLGGCLIVIVLIVAFIALLVKLFFWIV